MKKILSIFSVLLTGIEISNPEKYYSKWTLDLGAGNVLQAEENLGIYFL